MKTAAEFFAIFDRHGFLKSAVAGVGSAQVHLMGPGQYVLGDEVIVIDWAVTYPAGQLPGLKRGDSLTVDGVAYQVREVLRKPGTDGTETLAKLAKT